MNKENKKEGDSLKDILEKSSLKILKGIGISWVITFILLFIYAILLTYTKIEENTMVPVIILITAVSILAGSSIAVGSIKKNGMVNGGIIGFIYILMIYVLSSLLGSSFTLNTYSIIMVIARNFSRFNWWSSWSKFKMSKKRIL